MVKVGIDQISFYAPRHMIDLGELAFARGADPERFKKNVGQERMAVLAPDEDIVTMGAQAAQQVLNDIDLNTIDTLFFATESGIDQSKAAGLFVHELLELPKTIRVVEIKQACYAATAALRLSLPILQLDPDKKILVIASDNARYGLGSSGESSQGAGAVAFLLTSNPRIIAIEPEQGLYTESAMDFWRPNYCDEAFVDGMASSRLYLNCLEKTWRAYEEASQRHFSDHDFFCFHAPVARLVEKAFKHLMKISGRSTEYTEKLMEHYIGTSLYYNREIGNCYTAAMYLSLCGLLDQSQSDLAQKRVGFYSYGSGCVAEYFSGVIQDGYRSTLLTQNHEEQLKRRVPLSIEEYEAFYKVPKACDQGNHQFENYHGSDFRLAEIKDHKRIYTKSE